MANFLDIGAIQTGGLDIGAIQSDSAADPVQDVLDRMSALSQTEIDAITDFVNCLVTEGLWDSIAEVYAPCLNTTDFKTGFKFMTAVESENTPVHTAGQYVDFVNNSQHWLDDTNLDLFMGLEGFMGAYLVFDQADVTSNSDLFGVEDATQICYYRWRGDDTSDFNAQYNVTALTPRSASNVRPEGDFVGFGLDGTDQTELQPGGLVFTSTRIQNATVPKVDCQWHGHNINGVPAAGNMQNSRYSLMLHYNGALNEAGILAVRTCTLQFLQDIGVTGLPSGIIPTNFYKLLLAS